MKRKDYAWSRACSLDAHTKALKRIKACVCALVVRVKALLTECVRLSMEAAHYASHNAAVTLLCLPFLFLSPPLSCFYFLPVFLTLLLLETRDKFHSSPLAKAFRAKNRKETKGRKKAKKR